MRLNQSKKNIMDFKDSVKQLCDRVVKLKDQLKTEEATKNAFVMPFFQMLGYDVFNPMEIVPEMICDIGTKKGEKIDYAILKDGEPIILIECKHWQQNLSLHDNQLLRYFNVSKAKFGILTNGIQYKFYTDLAEPNKMDETPFLDIDFLNVKDQQIEELKKFHKSYFDIDTILSSASDLKYTSDFKNVLLSEFSNPSAEFVKIIAKQAYDGMITPKLLAQFTELLKRSIANHINDVIAERLNLALKSQDIDVPVAPVIDTNLDTKAIETTSEEIEGYYIIKSILRSILPVERIFYRDQQTYFSLLIDDNNRKLICRLYLNSPTNKQISFVGEDKKEIKYKISSIDDIFSYTNQLLESVKRHIDETTE